MIDREQSPDLNREAKWKEFCQRVDNGDFDAEVESHWEALEGGERLTTPEDLMEAVVIKDQAKRFVDDTYDIMRDSEIEKAASKEMEDMIKDYLSLPEDAKIAKIRQLKKEHFKKDPANFQKYLKGEK